MSTGRLELDPKKNIIDIKNGRIEVTFQVLSSNEEEGWIDCYIPAFDIAFAVKSENEKERTAKSSIIAFLNYWVDYKGRRSFFLHINELGFRTYLHNSKMKQLLENKATRAKFEPSNFNNYFPQYSKIENLQEAVTA